MNKWVYTVAALMSVVLLHPATSIATDISGRLSTAIEWYEAPGTGSTAAPAYLYGFLNASKIGDLSGLNFRGYGRLASDLNNEVDKENRLYYAYLEKYNLLPGMDVRLGRQFISTTAGAQTMDGLDVRYNVSGPYNVRLFGGGATTFDDDYDNGNYLYGGEFRAKYANHEAALSFIEERDDEAVTRTLIGIDARCDVDNAYEFTADLQYNYLSAVWSHAYAEVNYHANPVWGLSGHYLFDLPVFSSTSIYSVFATDNYQEFGLEWTYNFQSDIRGVARYTRELYQTGADANVFEGGVEWNRHNLYNAYLFATLRRDSDGQGLSGFKGMFSYELHPYFQPGIGIHMDVLERRLEGDKQTTSQRLWVFVKSELTDRFSLDAKLEQSSSDLYDRYLQGRLQANYRF